MGESDKKKNKVGQPLQRFRWWQLLSRSLFYLTLVDSDGCKRVYAVDVRHSDNADYNKPRMQLYVDGIMQAEVKMPAATAVPGGVIETSASMYGMKRCHYVADDGVEYQLIPDPKSAEGYRARLKHKHPFISFLIGFLSLVVLVISLCLLAVQGLELITSIPSVNQYIGSFESPIHLSSGINTALGVAALVASTERALRLRYNWLLDGSSDFDAFLDIDFSFGSPGK